MSRLLPRALVSLGLGLGLALVAGLVASTGEPSEATSPALVAESWSPTRGDPVPGAFLTAELGTWQAPGPESYSFQWLRDSMPVPGATAQDYVVQSADVGHQLAPQVTGHRDGYDPGTFTGTAVTIRKLGTSMTLDVKRAHPPGKRKLRWTAISFMSTERPWATDGTVTVSKAKGDHLRVLGTGLVVRGAAIVTLPWKRAPRGETEVIACFSGSEALEASCSPVEVVRSPERH